MRHSSLKFWLLYALICITITIFLLPRVWALRLLYTDPDVRQTVRATIEMVADREGWLISDMPLLRIDHDGMTILHHEHVRDVDPTTCYRITFTDAVLAPCS